MEAGIGWGGIMLGFNGGRAGTGPENGSALFKPEVGISPARGPSNPAPGRNGPSAQQKLTHYHKQEF